MVNRFQFCFNFAFKFNLRRYTKSELVARLVMHATPPCKVRLAGLFAFSVQVYPSRVTRYDLVILSQDDKITVSMWKMTVST